MTASLHEWVQGAPVPAVTRLRPSLSARDPRWWVQPNRLTAVLFTIVENCRRQGIDPFAYLRDVFDNAGSITTRNVADWTPAGWAGRHGQGRAARRSA